MKKRKKPKRKVIDKSFKIAGGKIASALRIRLPNDYMHSITNYDPDKTQKLKQWAVEQAQLIRVKDQDGNLVQPEIIKTAQKIYDWVIK